MKKVVAAVLAALVALSATPGTGHAETGPDTAPTRVLIVGDSVTQGSRGDFTWRYFAWKGLQAAHADVDFVGTRTGPFGIHDDGGWDWDYQGEDAYADPDFDQDHSAFYGGRIGPADNWFYEPIEQTLAATDPDVVMSLWGWNDLHHADDGPAEVAALYRDWIVRVRAVDPDVDLVIGALPQVWDEEVVELDALLVDLGAELTTEQSRVVVAQMQVDYTRDGDSLDDVHPNDEGQRKIAGMMGGALLDLLGIPVPPAEPTSEPTPDPTPEPTSDPSPEVTPEPEPEPTAEPEPTPTPTPTPPPLPVPEAPSAPVAPPVPVGVEEALVQASTQPSVAPAAPSRVRARARGARTVVTWRRSEGATTYAVRCGRASDVVTRARAVLQVRARTCRVRATSPVGASPWVRVAVRVAQR